MFVNVLTGSERSPGPTSPSPWKPYGSCVVGEGFVALRIVPWLWELPPTDRRYYPLLTACVDLDIPFCTQVGHTGPLRPSETGRPIPYIDQVALDSPELVIVCGHIGYPWTTEMIAVADKHPNVYIDTSAYTVRRYPAELVDYMRGRGKKKVLFGTNYPMISPEHALRGVEDLGLDEEGLDHFLSGNPRRVSSCSDRFDRTNGHPGAGRPSLALTAR